MAQDMDQSTARQLFDEGGTFVFLDVPVGTEFGIDYNSWQVGEKFEGVKMIPPGVHFVYYSAVNDSGQIAPRTGFFHNFQQKEIHIKKWNKRMEDTDTAPVSDEEQHRIEDNKKELDRFLGAYPYESFKKWVSLTNHITEALMQRLQPGRGKICSVCEMVSEPSNSQSRAAHKAGKSTSPAQECTSLKQAESQLPDMASVPGSECNFSTIPKRAYPEGANASEITKYNMDHSYKLEKLLDTYYKDNPLDLLGEIQFAFVCFLIGQVYDGFEQWKQLVALLCSCEDAMAKYPELYTQFISVMHYHVKEIPEDFFVDIVSSSNFLTTMLHTFFVNLSESNADSALKAKGLRFKKHLEQKFNWDFTSEPDEYAPVIVDCA